MDYKKLDSKINDLNSRVNGMSFLTTKDAVFWRETWALVKEIGAEFKEIRYPTWQDKDAAWKSFQGIVEQMKADRDRKQREHDERAKSSEALKMKIIGMAQSAWPREDGFESLAMAVTGIVFAQLAAYIVEDMVRTLLGMESLTPREREKRRLTELSDRMKWAWNTFSERKQELLPKDRADCFKILEGVQSELQKAWDEWKTEGQAIHQEREDAFERKRQDKRRLISEMKALVRRADEKEAKDDASALMNEWKQVGFSGKGSDDQLWSDFKEALDDFWTTRKRGTVQRLESRLSNQEAFLEKMEESVRHDEGVLEDKREKLANVFDGRRADEIRSHLEEVIESLEKKIESKKEKIEEVESDIAEIKRRIRDIE